MKVIDKKFKFDEKTFKFYLSYENKTFEELYNYKIYDKEETSNIKEISKNVENGYTYKLIEYNNFLYSFSNPHKIKFIFPDGNTQEIYISNVDQIFFLVQKYNSTYLVQKTNSEEFEEERLQKNIPYKSIKLYKFKIEENMFNKSNTFIENYVELQPLDLSLYYNEYIDFYGFINNKHKFFIFSKERKEFFKFLSDEIKNNNKFICICGPEGIGKSTSILAFCRMNLSDYYYFYFNVKILNKFLNKKDKIKDIIIKELFHCLDYELIKVNIEKIDNIIKESLNVFEILTKIIYLNIIPIQTIIVIDQYKTRFDPNYKNIQKLKNLPFPYKELYFILISSMNEFDVKESIIHSLKGDENNLFFLNYIYICNLVNVSSEDLEELDVKDKQLLNDFGNSYYYYYKILQEKKNFKEHKKDFSEYFCDKIDNYIDKNLEEYYEDFTPNKKFSATYFIIMNNEDNISLDSFINNYEKIPFRYFKFAFNNNNYFRLDSKFIKGSINLSFQYNYYLTSFFHIYQKYLGEIKSEKILTKSSIINLNAMKLESSFVYYLWCTRKSNTIKDVKIIKMLEIDSFFIIKDKDKIQDLDKLKKGEGVLIKLRHQNAYLFDCGIIKKNNDDITFSLYLFQVTIKKEAKERFTVEILNEGILIVNCYLSIMFNISIKANYFAYVFDMNELDITTKKDCEINFIDYFCFNKEKLKLSKDKISLNKIYPKYRFKMKETDGKEMELYKKEDNFIDVKKFISTNEKELENSSSFLKRKRALMQETDEYLNKNIINDYSYYIKSIENYKSKFNNKGNKDEETIEEDSETDKNEDSNEKKKKITNKEKVGKTNENIEENKNKNLQYKLNYEQRELYIQEYLISEEFKDKILPGITFIVPNQSKLIDKIKGIIGTKEYINFIKIANINDNYRFLKFTILKKFNPFYHIPELNNYIILVDKKTKNNYFMDYVKRKKINLKDISQKDTFDNYTLSESEIYLISVLKKGLTFEE